MAYSLVERPEARYKILYGKHIELAPSSELPSQPDALFLEGLDKYGGFEVGDRYSYSESSVYSKIEEEGQKKGIKIYLGDIHFRGPFQAKYDWSSILRMVEACVGWKLARSLGKEIDRKIDQREKVSRRDALRMMGKGTAAVWGLSILSKLGVLFFREGQEIPRTAEKIITAEDQFHPEFFPQWFRNAVVAKKSITIGKREQTEHNRKAEIAISYGGLHLGLKEFLERGEEFCQRVVSRYPRWLLETLITEGNLDYLSLILEAKFDPQYGLWVITDRFHDEGLYFSVNREQEYLNARKEIR